jgi:hypothetical protein
MAGLEFPAIRYRSPEKRERMKRTFRTLIVVSLAFGLTEIVSISKAAAQCTSFNSSGNGAIQLQLWHGQLRFMQAALLEVKDQNDPIVGFWKAKFVSEGTSGIPDGTVVDIPFVQWHSDGTEIINSSRVPATQSFCLGVWQRTGRSDYEFNHFALSFDTSGSFVGPAQIRENITLDRKSDQYSGTFTIDQYNSSGSLLQEVKGQLTATRITVDITIDQIL